MTDNEIIKALECCTSSCREIKCNSCLAFVDCRCMLKPKMLLDLINRQKVVDGIVIDIKQAKSEAVKDFAEKLKERLAEDCDRVCERSNLLYGNISGYPIYEVEDCIDNLVKEMECGDND